MIAALRLKDDRSARMKEDRAPALKLWSVGDFARMKEAIIILNPQLEIITF